MKMNYTIHGLRGLCAMMVVVGHMFGMAINANMIAMSQEVWLWLEKAAGTGVNIFFVISGYIIIHSLVKHKDPRTFFKNRILRIYPVYVIIFLMMAILGPVIAYDWFAEASLTDYLFNVLGSFFMIQGMFGVEGVVPNGWTLHFEFVFYTISMLIFVAFSQKKNFVFGILLIALAILLVVDRPRFLFFLVGTIIYFTQRHLKRINLPFMTSGVMSLLSFVLTLYSEEFIYVSILFSFPFFVIMVKETGWFSSFLRLPVLKYLGTVSYSLYLWHAFGLFISRTIVPRVIGSGGTFTFLIFAISSIILSLIFAHISYHVVEVRITNRLKPTSFFARPKVVA